MLLQTIRGELRGDEPPDGGERAALQSFETTTTLWQWVEIADAYQWTSQDGQTKSVPFQIDVTLRADALSAIMMCMVTFISTLVAIYSAGYLHGDRGYWRFFTYISLFVFSMVMLASVSNLLLLFLFWEALGACSYLLIGFWYEKDESSTAGMKAFLVNRVGDTGFVIAIFLIWVTYGTLSFHDLMADDGSVLVHGLFGNARLTGVFPYATDGTAATICLLLLLAACVKSAQIPLHIWLPDATRGPIPAGALVQSVTMVAAGVYLVVRCTPLFMASPDAQLVVAWVGGSTALLAALIAMTQSELKRVLAYSTISQLGFVFLALGTGSLAGITAGMFHLFTHAFFNALLVLGAGSVMLAMGNVDDLRQFGGLRHRMPWTHRTFAVGCLALAGIFPFAGFWSKGVVLASVHEKAFEGHERMESSTVQNGAGRPTGALSKSRSDSEDSQHASLDRAVHFAWLYRIALFTSLLTAFYIFRAFYRTFYGDERIPADVGEHAHESPPSMWIPLAILALLAFLMGFYFELGHRFALFLESTPSLAYGAVQETLRPAFQVHVAVTCTAVTLAGIGLASYFYLGNQNEIKAIARLPLIRTCHVLSRNKFYVDELYHFVILIPVQFSAAVYYAIDRWVVDGLVNSVGKLPVQIGASARRLQTGLIPFYGLVMIGGTLIAMLIGHLLWGRG